MFNAYERVGLANSSNRSIPSTPVESSSISSMNLSDNMANVIPESIASGRNKSNFDLGDGDDDLGLDLEDDSPPLPPNPHQQPLDVDQDREVDDLIEDDNNCVMCVVNGGANQPFGVAYYLQNANTVYIGETDSIHNVNVLKYQHKPGQILTSFRATDVLFNELRNDDLVEEHVFSITTLRKATVDDSSLSHKLHNIQLKDTVSGNFEWIGRIDFAKKQMCRALAGLLSHLLTHRPDLSTPNNRNNGNQYSFNNGGIVMNGGSSAINNILNNDVNVDNNNNNNNNNHNYNDSRNNGILVLNDITSIPSSNIMEVNEATLSALSIFKADSHPGGGGRVKEGISVFGILDQTHTVRGKQLLKTWVKFPSTDIVVLTYRHDHISFLSHPSRTHIITQLRTHLRRVKDIPRILNRFFLMSAKASDWLGLIESLQHSLAIFTLIQSEVTQYVQTLKQYQQQRGPGVDSYDTVLFELLLSLDITSLTSLLATLTSHIDISLTNQESKVTVAHGVDQELDNLKSKLSVMDSFLAEVLASDLQNHLLPTCFESLYYCYFPQLGYLLATPYIDHQTPPTQVPGLEFQFRTEDYAFYSNNRTRELDVELGDVHGDACDRELILTQDLSRHVLENAGILESLCNNIYEIDVLCSLSIVANDFNLVRPVLSTDVTLHLTESRHILHELTLQSYISNDIHIDNNNHGLVHVVTGPNNSGKSVLLTAIGITVFLAHVGSFIPASQGIIGICDKIIMNTYTAHSHTSDVSTFVTDTSNLSRALHSATSHSLLLVDEFGTGTNSKDGAALCAALIRFLASQAAHGCKAMLTTHFHEMFLRGLIKESMWVRLHHMSCTINKTGGGQSNPNNNPNNSSSSSSSGGGNGNNNSGVLGELLGQDWRVELIPLFRLADGWEHNSYALPCAYTAGLNVDIIERADEIMQCFLHNKNVRPVSLIHKFTDDVGENRNNNVQANAGDGEGKMIAELSEHSQILKQFMDLAPHLTQSDSKARVEEFMKTLRGVKRE